MPALWKIQAWIMGKEKTKKAFQALVLILDLEKIHMDLNLSKRKEL